MDHWPEVEAKVVAGAEYLVRCADGSPQLQPVDELRSDEEIVRAGQ
jgi:hypothetical protein